MMMNKIALTLLAGVAMIGSPNCQADVQPLPQRPNIVLIFADDLGWKDVGYQGSDFHETPNIDRLAGEGMVFSAGYAAAGNCAPSRACLLSGNYTPGIMCMRSGSTLRGPQNLMRMIPVPNKSGLAAGDHYRRRRLESRRDTPLVTSASGTWPVRTARRPASRASM